MVFNIIEEKKIEDANRNRILKTSSFENVMNINNGSSGSSSSSSSSGSSGSNINNKNIELEEQQITQNTNYNSEILKEKTNISLDTINSETKNETDTETKTKTENKNETINKNEELDNVDVNELQKESSTLYNNIPTNGGATNSESEYIFNIDYILEDDEKLINIEKVTNNVDKYIKNYYSPELQKYKKNFKQIYQKYSNKNYIITTEKDSSKQNKLDVKSDDKKDSNLDISKTYISTKIIVKKNDKSNKIIMELKKQLYIYYDEDNKLIKLNRKISNERTELLYKYEQLIAKINITPEEKKVFEKERSKFIELLEEYYTYTLYHKKINKIIKLNKSNLVLQNELNIYKENNEYETKILSSEIYLIDNSFIDTMNTRNSENLLEYNNIIQTLQTFSGKKNKETKENKENKIDKKITESIKSYIKNKNEIELFTKSMFKNIIIQDEYINFIVFNM